MVVNVWLNHWFSTARNIIELLKENNANIHVIGSNENEYSVIKSVCDEWYREPILKDEKYVEFCLDFCVSHKVDVFMPRREMINISKHKGDFERIGVKVMMDDYSIVSILNHKEAAYDYFIKNKIGKVPDYSIVTTSEEFLTAYKKTKHKNDFRRCHRCFIRERKVCTNNDNAVSTR